MMRKIIISISLIVVVMSCKKEPETRLVEQYLKDMVPYKEGQIVTFVSTQGDTAKGRVTVKRSFEETSNCAECDVFLRQEYFTYEISDVKPNPYPRFIELEIVQRVENTVFLDLYSPLKSYLGYGHDIFTQHHMSKFDCSQSICHDSITINSILYTDVTELRGPVEINRVYYSKEKGVIYFSQTDGIDFYVYLE